MGSQTLEILRQFLASLTGGYFYDPHQGVFCNAVHLYLWLFLLCSPFVAYLYFPGTWLTWCIYCILTSTTILGVKLINMALHRLYDRAQSMPDTNLKHEFFKITKETESREDDTGIEMKVMGNNGSRDSVENAIHEASDENSMLSTENVDSIIDLKVDVHRKNSSESIEMMFYPPSRGSQQDQHSIAGSASVSKSLRSNNTATGGSGGGTVGEKYLTVYPGTQSSNANALPATILPTATTAISTRQHLLRKSSEDFKRRHQQRRRLERQRSLDTAPDTESIGNRLMRNPSDSLATRNDTFLHSQAHYYNINATSSKIVSIATAPPSSMSTAASTSAASATTNPSSINAQRLPIMATTTTIATNAATTVMTANQPTVSRSSRLQRHRSSETHDERLKQQNRNIYLPIHHEQLHHGTSGASSIGALASIGAGIGSNMMDANELELGDSASGVTDHVGDVRVSNMETWISGSSPGVYILGSSSDIYIGDGEDDSYTKSEYGIEQFDDGTPGNTSHSTFLQQQQLNSQFQQLPRFRHQRQGGIKRRRHSNATTLYKNCGNGKNGDNDIMSPNEAEASADVNSCAANIVTMGGIGPQTSVRRIKSAALEISCPRPSISNLSPHPNSVEAINGQQQIRNTTASLLPPPSKCLVRNPHLTLCPKFGGSFGGSTESGNHLTFGVNTSSDSTLALIEPVYPIVEQSDEKSSDKSKQQKKLRRMHNDVERCKHESADVDIDLLNIIATRVHDGHADEDDDDAVDDVPVQRRRTALDCRQSLRGSLESDVGEILADDDDDDDDVVDDSDAFKDFDKDLDHILQDLQQTHNQLDEAKLRLETGAASCEKTENTSHAKKSTEEDDYYDGPSCSQLVMRERLHSTDSETDNKGSRSPLLSGKKWECNNATAKAADKELQNEIVALQQKHKQTPPCKRAQSLQQPPQVLELQTRGEGDSGCPSSDCEQISASSKDMLLSGLDAHEGNVNVNDKSKFSAKDVEEGGADIERKPSGKHLGAIPKIVKYREIDETHDGRGAGTSTSAMSNSSSQLHKRRSGSGKSTANCISCTTGKTTSGPTHDDRSLTSVTSTKAISRTSSSTSSCSLNACSFSADMQKMLWFMHGGAMDERGRPVAGICQESMNIPPNASIVMPPFSSAHFQFYQEALQNRNASSSCQPSSSTDGLSLSEHRQYAREKLRRSSKQISEPSYNASLAEFSQHALELPSAQLSSTLFSGGTAITSSSGGGSGRASMQHHSPFGVVFTSCAVNSGNASNAATFSMHGIYDALNEGRNAADLVRAVNVNSSSGVNAASILNVVNVGGHGCDYWRPACMLSADKPVLPKSFYKYRLRCWGYKHDLKVSMDRLELLALFDRDLHWLHIILSVVLCATVAYLGATILQHGYYKDLFAFVFCAVIAGSQYSLVKSVQPDAASPIHGFNKTVAYSRAIYFCLCGALLLLFEHLKHVYKVNPPGDFSFFGVVYAPAELNTSFLQIMYILLLFFPIIFSLGLFPQVNTFLMYFLEQVDMHIFGGNAAGSLLGSFLCVLRSIFGVMLVYGPLYAALADGRGTQYIVFSIFCAMLIPLGYHLSRSASDFSHLWALIKNCIVSTYRDDDDELSASASGVSSQKLNLDTPKSRTRPSAKHDLPPTEGSNENIEMSSMEKLPPTDGRGDELSHRHNNLERRRSKSKASSLGSSSQTLGKAIGGSKKAMTGSNSYISIDGAAAGSVGEVTGISKSEHELNEMKSSNITNDSSMAAIPVPVEQISANKLSEERVIHKKDIENAEIDEVDDKFSTSSTTNPGDMSTLTAGGGDDGIGENGIKLDSESPDPLPKKLQTTVNTRLKNDLVVMTFLSVVVLGLHSSTVFTVLQPDLNIVLYAFTGALGLMLHYIIPQMRKHMPWLCFSRPLLRQKEYGQFEVSNAPKVMWFEKFYIYLCLVERNVLFPLLVISALTADAQTIAQKYGIAWGTLIVAVCALKFIRNAYSDATNQYLIIIFTFLFFRVDFALASETFLIDYFFVSLAYRKCCDFLLKLQFIVTYIAPWQITWGSAFHAFAQPFSVPHSAMLFLQAGVSAALSTPLNPFLGSAIFLTSYVRPIKFWERDYNTRRIDHSNTRLVSQLERDLGADDNNLNSIFYEHLTRSLQHSLCGDLLMGRWGNVNQGDCFVLASDYLNCLVHIIELGNGLCTFQMRGLEFRGTYCQQREVEAITEDVEDNDGCCCCDPGHLPRMLSANAMFSTRWLAWQVVAAQYVLEGYSISDNLASATLQVFEYRKVLITYYIKSIIYYVIKNNKLEQWLTSGPIQDALQHLLSRNFIDLDVTFTHTLDEDFDFRASGITRSTFCYVYLSWINFCYDKRKESQNAANATPNSAQHMSGTSPNNTATTNTNNNNNNNNNDSKSTPNLSMATLVMAANPPHAAKSQSQQQLRTRPQKSSTMSSSAMVNNNSGDHMATSQSYANILRQTSESAPGLNAMGFGFPFTPSSSTAPTTATIVQSRLDGNSLNNSTTTVGGNNINFMRTPLGLARGSSMKTPTDLEDNKPDLSSLPMSGKEGENREKPVIKLKVPSVTKDSPIVSLCLALSLLARRSLATASHSALTSGVEFFLHGLHALFKGDFRITSPRDEWVFADMDLLHAVVAPAVKMALKLQQDHISNPDEFLDPSALYEAIDTCSKDLVISHEADPVWRSAVLRGAPNLLALRHVMEDGSDEYRIIRLAKRFLSFRVIKLNRECVRGLWAGQQQELIYLRNRNPERGSIQNAKQALRNIINSSCDQPIGYPIYVSPLTTSYADTNAQLCDIVGGAITLEAIKSTMLDWWQRIRERCRQGCSSGSAMGAGAESMEIAPVCISAPLYNTLIVNNCIPTRQSPAGVGASLSSQYGSDGLNSSMRSGHLGPVPLKSTALFATFLSRDQEAMREFCGLRKSLTQATHAGSVPPSSDRERERRATLPITSTGLGVAGSPLPSNSGNEVGQNEDCHLDMATNEGAACSNSPRYAKISSSSCSLGIGHIITTPGDYPRKTKGPICLTTVSGGGDIIKSTETTPIIRKPRIELYRKVIIVDGKEIYLTWPGEERRPRGGHMPWKDWVPRVGMVGYVVHYWVPNHSDQRFRSNFNRVVYLVEIGEHYVPVGEYGLREYNQILGDETSATSSSMTTISSRHSSLHYHHELDELRQHRDNLTPISSSDFESPVGRINDNVKIRAVSSSSSDDEDEDEVGLMNFEVNNRDMLMTVLKLIAKDTQQQYQKQEKKPHSTEIEEIEESTSDKIETEQLELEKEQEQEQEHEDAGEDENGKDSEAEQTLQTNESSNKENILTSDEMVTENIDAEETKETTKKLIDNSMLSTTKEIFVSADSKDSNEDNTAISPEKSDLSTSIDIAEEKEQINTVEEEKYSNETEENERNKESNENIGSIKVEHESEEKNESKELIDEQTEQLSPTESSSDGSEEHVSALSEQLDEMSTKECPHSSEV